MKACVEAEPVVDTTSGAGLKPPSAGARDLAFILVARVEDCAADTAMLVDGIAANIDDFAARRASAARCSAIEAVCKTYEQLKRASDADRQIRQLDYKMLDAFRALADRVKP